MELTFGKSLLKLSGLIFLFTLFVGCGQQTGFKGSNFSKASGSDVADDQISESELIEMVDEETLLIVDDLAEPQKDKEISMDDEKEDAKEQDGTQGTMPVPGGLDPLMGIIGGIGGGLMPGDQMPGDGSGEAGNGCGDRDSHKLKIVGPNGAYIGIGPGSVEVSTNQAYVCLSEDEVLVGIGDINENLQDAASCSNTEDQVYICQRSADKSEAVESCISKEKLYVHIKKQSTEDKTYLGRCLK